MPVMTQSKNLGDVLKYEAPNLYSREAATVAAGQNLQLGTVLGKKTADGKLHALAPAASRWHRNRHRACWPPTPMRR
jgi:hypothetical protein